jgi:uncharacterized protein
MKENTVTISMHRLAVDTFVPMLSDLSRLLDKGAEFAETKHFDPENLVSARLAPDMYALGRQVQLACDNAKGAVARVIGKEAPRHEDNEKTIADLKGRIAKTIDYLKSLTSAEFESSEEQNVRLDLPGDLVLEMSGFNYLKDWGFPHFYFHVVTAYNILRHNGIDIGKRDYMGHVGAYIRPRNK